MYCGPTELVNIFALNAEFDRWIGYFLQDSARALSIFHFMGREMICHRAGCYEITEGYFPHLPHSVRVHHTKDLWIDAFCPGMSGDLPLGYHLEIEETKREDYDHEDRLVQVWGKYMITKKGV